MHAMRRKRLNADARSRDLQVHHLKQRLQLSKVEVGVEARALMPDGAFLGGFDFVPMELLQLAPLAGCGPHLQQDSGFEGFRASVSAQCTEPVLSCGDLLTV